MTRILVLNPNSSSSVTDNLKVILSAPPNVEFGFYTGPSTSPREIIDVPTSIESEQACLKDILGSDLLDSYDAILVCCYSDHPLIHSLAQHTKIPILGIMQATLLYSLANAKFRSLFVLTSVNSWELLLDSAIISFVGNKAEFPSGKFLPTKALDVSVTRLSDPEEYAKIYNRVNHILTKEYAGSKVDCILLGCAGMAGLDEKLLSSFPGIVFVDSVKIGVEFLNAMTRFG